MAKLNQIIAIEKGIKSRVYGEIGELHKISQKPELFNGFARNYQRVDDESEDLPPEKKRVQYSTKEVLKTAERLQGELLNITARKDWTNCTATADIVIDGKAIVKDAPVTYLLFLEKQLTDMRTFINSLPVLDENENWALDANSGLYKTEVTKTHRNKRTVKPIVLIAPTEHHPGQAQLVQEDTLAGFWNNEKHSGAIPKPEKLNLLARVESLLQATKQAREAANAVDEFSPAPSVGDAVFNFLFEE